MDMRRSQVVSQNSAIAEFNKRNGRKRIGEERSRLVSLSENAEDGSV